MTVRFVVRKDEHGNVEERCLVGTVNELAALFRALDGMLDDVSGVISDLETNVVIDGVDQFTVRAEARRRA